jgi:hypothetical protein
MHATCLILGLDKDRVSLGIELIHTNAILCGFDTCTCTCTTTLLQTTRTIGEYYFWYDQILVPLPGNQLLLGLQLVGEYVYMLL